MRDSTVNQLTDIYKKFFTELLIKAQKYQLYFAISVRHKDLMIKLEPVGSEVGLLRHMETKGSSAKYFKKIG